MLENSNFCIIKSSSILTFKFLDAILDLSTAPLVAAEPDAEKHRNHDCCENYQRDKETHAKRDIFIWLEFHMFFYLSKVKLYNLTHANVNCLLVFFDGFKYWVESFLTFLQVLW